MSSQPESSDSQAANTTVLGDDSHPAPPPTQHTWIVDNFDGTPKEVQPIGSTTTGIQGQNLDFKNLLSLKPPAGSYDPYGAITPEHRREHTGVLDGPPTSACQRIHSIYDQLWKENRLLAQVNTVLLYVVPRLRRDGGVNNQWRECCFYYTTANSEAFEARPVALSERDHVGDSGEGQEVVRLSSTTSSPWECIKAFHVFDDPVNGDRVFRLLIPRCASITAPLKFFMKDQDSDDRDHPNGYCGAEERSMDVRAHNYYTLLDPLECPSRIGTLRDGVLVSDDQVSCIGIRICFDVAPNSHGVQRINDLDCGPHLLTASQTSAWGSSFVVDTATTAISTAPPSRTPSPRNRSGRTTDGENVGPTGESEWCRPTLHFLDEIRGDWCERPFVRSGVMSEMSVTLLEVKSVTFVIRDQATRRWLKPSDNTNFRIDYPGTYTLFSDGKLLETSSGIGAQDRNVPRQPLPPFVYSLATPRCFD
eukprot:GHVN01066951.1.p1 GENE.GHVN01066951.1~~GHVN01066951.1.p1  ORF type:complete len:477 (+),score=65.73 GHVN01066951.1:125-1555(+)